MTDQRNIKDVIIKVFGEDLEKASRYYNSFETPAGKQSSLAASPSTYQCLYLWLAGTGGPRVSYDFQSFPESYLFNFNDSSIAPPDTERPADPPDAEKKNPSSDDGGCYCLGMHCAKLGSNIFLVGGQEPQKMEASTPLALPPYSLHEYSSSVFVVDAARPSQQEVPKMNSGKASPLVVSVGESLYVLAGTPVNMLPNPAFEKCSYDNKTSSWKWTNLPSPPFLDPSCKYFEDPQYCGYAVIKHKIHVSTSSSSFYFDTVTEKWNPSSLFGYTQAEDIQYPPPFEWMNYPMDNDGGNDGRRVGGAPFDFNGEAVLYGDDVLICIILSKGIVAAHHLVDGRVDSTQLLEGLKFPTDALSACLADFGRGDLCLVVSYFDPNQDLEIFKTEISIKPFRVAGNVKKELNCDVLEKRTATKQFYFKIWSVTSCFVHNNSISITSTRDDPSFLDILPLKLLEQPSSSTSPIRKEEGKEIETEEIKERKDEGKEEIETEKLKERETKKGNERERNKKKRGKERETKKGKEGKRNTEKGRGKVRKRDELVEIFLFKFLHLHRHQPRPWPRPLPPPRSRPLPSLRSRLQPRLRVQPRRLLVCCNTPSID